MSGSQETVIAATTKAAVATCRFRSQLPFARLWVLCRREVNLCAYHDVCIWIVAAQITIIAIAADIRVGCKLIRNGCKWIIEARVSPRVLFAIAAAALVDGELARESDRSIVGATAYRLEDERRNIVIIMFEVGPWVHEP